MGITSVVSRASTATVAVKIAQPLGLFGPEGGFFFDFEVLGSFGEQLGVV